jgi:hypothetical protein
MEAGPSYSIPLKSCAAFTLTERPGSTNVLSFSPISELERKVFDGSHARKVVAAGYDSGIHIVAKNGVFAAEDILSQIADATGLNLHYSVDSRLEAIRPAVIVQGFSETAVVTVVLTPTTNDEFIVSCAYVIDSRNEGSIDGTPTSVAQMRHEKAEMARVMNDDSIADALPASISDAQLEDRQFGREFFRGVTRTFGERNGGFFPLVVLMLKRKDAYTLGYYEKTGDRWTIVEKPVAMSGTKSPYFTNLPNENRVALRGEKLDQSGSVFIYLENGHVVRREM